MVNRSPQSIVPSKLFKFIITICFILLAFGAIFFWWQRAKENKTAREQVGLTFSVGELKSM